MTSKIYISKDTIEKAKHGNLDRQTKVLLEKFNPNRPEPKHKQIPAQDKEHSRVKAITDRDHRKNSLKQSRKALYNQLIKIRQTHGIPAPKVNNSKSKRVLEKIARIKEEKQKLKRVRKISGDSKLLIYTNAHNKGFSTNKPQKQSSRRQQKTAYYKRVDDEYDLAGEYESRNVEYGHGRKKTMEWNDKIARVFAKQLGNPSGRKKADPNTFDRGAMK